MRRPPQITLKNPLRICSPPKSRASRCGVPLNNFLCGTAAVRRQTLRYSHHEWYHYRGQVNALARRDRMIMGAK